MASKGAEYFTNYACGELPVRGFLHRALAASRDALVLTHGAGGNCNSPLLVALADAFAASGLNVLRCDLPFRQVRRHGPPSPAGAERDRQGLRRALMLMREQFAGRMFLAGQSYGGRQASMLVALEPALVTGLLLLSYPLHPPGRAAQLRTAHFPDIRTPSLFLSGTKDVFGSIPELETAIKLIPARTQLAAIAGAGHNLATKANCEELAKVIVTAFWKTFGEN
jgi:predicted alpha/beta-hydrolase family hydrolase